MKTRSEELDLLLHELRSPLTAIILNAGLALADEASNEELRSAVEVALRQANRLAELIDEFDEADKAHRQANGAD